MTGDPQRLPVRRAPVQFRDDGDQALLIAPGKTTGYALNPTARAIWELCDGATTVEEMADAICHVFNVTRPTALTDVIEVLNQLTAAEFVDWSPART